MILSIVDCEGYRRLLSIIQVEVIIGGHLGKNWLFRICRDFPN